MELHKQHHIGQTRPHTVLTYHGALERASGERSISRRSRLSPQGVACSQMRVVELDVLSKASVADAGRLRWSGSTLPRLICKGPAIVVPIRALLTNTAISVICVLTGPVFRDAARWCAPLSFGTFFRTSGGSAIVEMRRVTRAPGARGRLRGDRFLDLAQFHALGHGSRARRRAWPRSAT